MPTFCYSRTVDGRKHTIERFYPFGKEPKTVTVDGSRYRRDLAAEWCGGKAEDLTQAWPILSDSIGVHPSQVKEAEEHAKKHGVPTEFTPDGRCILRNKQHRKAYAELIGHYDLNGGYSDPQRGGRN